MNRDEVFSVWAPQSSIWSRWVAPVLFAQTFWDTRIESQLISPSQQLAWLQQRPSDTAVVVDLPGSDSVEVGFALAAAGWQPVPLYNASPGPEEIVGLGAGSPGVWNAVIDMGPIVDAISRVTASLQQSRFSGQVAPAFLLDSVRLSGTKPVEKGVFDNRWMVFPQDFPSASFLLQHGIRQALVIQKGRLEPQDDLAHTLLRWQEAGIVILSKKLDDDSFPVKIMVKRPSRYKATWYRALAQLGLRRSSAGGFGSYIPETTAAG
jgi:hypothetical protein